MEFSLLSTASTHITYGVSQLLLVAHRNCSLHIATQLGDLLGHTVQRGGGRKVQRLLPPHALCVHQVSDDAQYLLFIRSRHHLQEPTRMEVYLKHGEASVHPQADVFFCVELALLQVSVCVCVWWWGGGWVNSTGTGSGCDPLQTHHDSNQAYTSIVTY